MIELRGLKKIYEGKQRIEALKEINLKVNQGEICGIIGQSGAGKSTLVRCINLLEQPTNGQVIVDGVDLTSLDDGKLREARKNIGMIFQHFNLLSSRTVYDNVAFPLELQGLSKSEIRDRVMPLLELVQLTDRANNYPSQLSGGQKQRVGIARALASEPKVLLCDEATSALDPQTTQSILRLLKDINKRLNLTIVLITHEMHVIKEICDKVAVIEGGYIIEEGPVIDVFINPKQETTKQFVTSIIGQDLPQEAREHMTIYDEPIGECRPLVLLSFTGTITADPIVSNVGKKFGVDMSIFFGQVDYIQETAFGRLIVTIVGNAECVDKALAYLDELPIRNEVIGYVPVHD